MGLLDLPPELFQAVVDAMVAAGTSRKTTNLRLVNKLFNHAVVDALLRSGYINPKRYWWSKRICPEFLLKFLMWKMELDKTIQHPLRIIVNSSIDLFTKGQLAIRGIKNHRPTLKEEYTYILLQSTVEHVCAEDVLAYLEPVQKDISPAETLCGALAIAASLGDLMIVKSLLDDGANIKQQSEYFSSPLRCAARCDKLDVVRWLLDCGADITNPIPWKKHDSTALDSACYAGHKEIVQLLLEPNYSLEKSGPNYERAACSALRKSHLGLVRYLIDEYTADVAYLKQTLFVDAVALGYLAVASMMLDEGADIDGKTRLVHVSALELAAKGGHTSVVQFLLDRGHDRRPSKCGNALITAARFGRKDIVWLLLKNGVDVNATTARPCDLPFGGTAIEAAVDNDDEDMVRFLLDHGVDLNAKRQGYKALQTACRKRYVALVRFFIDVCGLDPNGSALNKAKRFPPMLTALCYNCTDVVKELLRLGADEVDPLTSVMSGHFRRGWHLETGEPQGHI